MGQGRRDADSFDTAAKAQGMTKGYISDSEARLRENPRLGIRSVTIENRRAARSVIKYMEEELVRQQKSEVEKGLREMVKSGELIETGSGRYRLAAKDPKP